MPMPKTTGFVNMDEACQALLRSTAAILGKVEVGFVVVGGWSPVLLEPNHSSLRHPGTRDVDVLLNDNPIVLESAVRALFDGGFRPSAKHEFQLLRSAQVNGKWLVFNIDLMTPREIDQNADSFADMFTDLLDLEVRERADDLESRFIKSIAFDTSAIVLSEGQYIQTPLNGPDLDGADTNCSAPILDLPAFVLSKCQSIKSVKRPRDAFDLYYVLTAPGGDATIKELARRCQKKPAARKALNDLRVHIEGSRDRFEKNVRYYAGDTLTDLTPTATFLALLPAV